MPGDPDILVPDVFAGPSHVLITEWMDGHPSSPKSIKRGFA